MKIWGLFFLIILSSTFVQAQKRNFLDAPDSISTPRLWLVNSFSAADWTGEVIFEYNYLNKNYPKSDFHVVNDFPDWYQIDKFAIFYLSNKYAYQYDELYKWTGMDHKKAVLLGSGFSFGFKSTFTVLNGFNSKVGFSWTDILANGLGAGTYAFQQLAWKEERILFKASYHPTSFASIRPSELGYTTGERILKDYNGQTYWMSINPSSFLKDSRLPKWLLFSVGYSITEKLDHAANIYLDPNSNVIYHAQRQFFLSLDVDFSKLPIKNYWIKKVVGQFNYLKIPFPAINITGGKLGGNWLYF